MTAKEAVIWLINITADIGKAEHGGLWHYEQALMEIREMFEADAQQWIPCSEHPDTDRNVFIARGKTDLLSCCIGHYDHNAKLWYEDRNWFAKIMYDAMYWCEMPPLPKPWKGKES